MKLYIPEDTAALAVGADELAVAAAALGAEVVRTSSRGLLWLEPLVEVDTPEGRFGWGGCGPEDLPAIVAGERGHAKAIGLVEDHPYLKSQQRLTFARAGITRPLSLEDYEAHGGMAGLRAARAMAPDAIWQQVLDSGLRGRGGAAFPAGIKWRTVAQAQSAQKYVVCNADEGDSGTFADRMVMEGDPFLLIEGMAIAALSVGASRGYVYVRSEYPRAFKIFGQAIEVARAAGWLQGFDLQVRMRSEEHTSELQSH